MRRIFMFFLGVICINFCLKGQTVTRSWDFDDPVVNNVADGWNIFLYGSPHVEDGVLKLTAVNQGGYCNLSFTVPEGQSIIDPSVSKRIVIRVKNGTKGRVGNFLWKVNNGANYNKMELLMSTEDTDFKEYVLDLTHDLRWTGNITSILMQLPIPINAASNNLPFDIDYIRVTETPTTAQLPTMIAKFPAPFGVNLSGGEFAFGQPNSQWRYPRLQELDYLAAKGFRLIRLPFLWERLQPTLNGGLDVESLSQIKNIIWAARARGIWVLLDLHNYNRRGFINQDNSVTKYVIGSPQVPITAIQDFWKKMAHEFKDFGNIYAYGIMNEPYGTPKEYPWVNTAQAIIEAIRTEDTQNSIMVGGDSYSSASNWPSASDNLRKLTDPYNNLIFEAHTYFDKSAGGTYNGSYATEQANPQTGVSRLAPFVNWLKKYSLRGFVGEYGIPNNPNADADKTDAADNSLWNNVMDNAMQYLEDNGVNGTYWSYGTSWGTYKLSVFPNSDGTERPQMAVLEQHLTSGLASTLPQVTSPFVVNYNLTEAVNYQLTASNNPTGFTVDGLPAGLSYNSSTSMITGNAAAGEHTFTVTSSNGSGSGDQREILIRVVDPKIPGILEAENYDTGGQGIGYYDKSIGNNGNYIYRDEDVDLRRLGNTGNYTYAVTSMTGGEWLKYTADVDTGSYGVKLSYVTTTPGSALKIKLDDVVVADNLPLPVTPDLNNWSEAYFELVNVAAGQHVLTVEALSGDFDFDRLNLDLIMPAAIPGNVIATAFGSKQVDLSWDVAENASTYIVERSTTENGTYTVIAQDLTAASYSDENVTSSTTYFYKIKSENVLGISGASVIAAVTTGESSLPQKVTDVVISAGNAKVSLNWEDLPDVNHYNIKRSTIQGGPYTVIGTSGSAAYVDQDVVNNTVYYYVLTAENENGEGEASDELMAKPVLGQYLYYTFDLDNTATPTTPIVDAWGTRNASFDPAVLIGTNQSTSHITFVEPAHAVQNWGMRLRGRDKSYIELPQGLMSDVDDFTISFWFRQIANQNGSRLFEFGSDDKYMSLSARAGSNNVLTYKISNGVDEQVLSTNISITNSTAFRQFVLTQSGSTVTLYLDGVQVGQSNDFTIKPSDLGFTTDNFIGKSRFTTAHPDGVFDDFKILDIALTAAEVMSMNDGTLPVTVVDFNAKKQNNAQVLLNWRFVGADDNARFDLLRSTDGKVFNRIASIPGSAIQTAGMFYNYVDHTPGIGVNYYKLMQLDKNGKTANYSRTVNVSFGAEQGSFKIYAAHNKIKLNAIVKTAADFQLWVTDLSGRRVGQFKGHVVQGNNHFEFPLSHYVPGIYIVTYVSNTEKKSVRLLLRN